MVLEVKVDAVRRDQETLPPARDRRPRVAEIVGRVVDHRVLGDRADAHHETVAGEPGREPDEVERRMPEHGEETEQYGVGDDHAAERLDAGVEVPPDPSLRAP